MPLQTPHSLSRSGASSRNQHAPILHPVNSIARSELVEIRKRQYIGSLSPSRPEMRVFESERRTSRGFGKGNGDVKGWREKLFCGELDAGSFEEDRVMRGRNMRLEEGKQKRVLEGKISELEKDARIREARIRDLTQSIDEAETWLKKEVEGRLMMEGVARGLAREVKSMHGQLALQITAVQVEQLKVGSMMSEIEELKGQVVTKNRLLKEEKMKTKKMVDREMERGMGNGEEKLMIALEKFRVMSEGLSEERNRVKKLKEEVASVKGEMNGVKKQANEKQFRLQMQVDWEKREREKETTMIKKLREKLDIAHSLVEFKWAKENGKSGMKGEKDEGEKGNEGRKDS